MPAALWRAPTYNRAPGDTVICSLENSIGSTAKLDLRK